MLLRFLATSPYVRKVMVLALEAGLGERIEKIPTSPQADEDSLIEHNPLSKVPTLICDDGTVLYDSPVICEYLDSLHEGPRFFPEEGKARWEVLRRQALADGILDALILRRYEGMRPAELRSESWAANQTRKVERGLDALEKEAEEEILADPYGPLTVGEIAVACALGYMDFRFPDDDWRRNRPALASWFDDVSQRPSIRHTAPPVS